MSVSMKNFRIRGNVNGANNMENTVTHAAIAESSFRNTEIAAAAVTGGATTENMTANLIDSWTSTKYKTPQTKAGLANNIHMVAAIKSLRLRNDDVISLLGVQSNASVIGKKSVGIR